MPEIAPVVTLGHMHCFAARMPHTVHWRAIVEAARLDDKRVAPPTADRISEVCRKFPRGGKFAAIHEDLAVEAVDFVKNHGLFGGLHNLEWLGKSTSPRAAILG